MLIQVRFLKVRGGQKEAIFSAAEALGTMRQSVAETGGPWRETQASERSRRMRHQRALRSARPGIFSAGTHEFHVASPLLQTAETGREFLGRIEERDGAWWLFDLRFFAAPGQ